MVLVFLFCFSERNLFIAASVNIKPSVLRKEGLYTNNWRREQVRRGECPNKVYESLYTMVTQSIDLNAS